MTSANVPLAANPSRKRLEGPLSPPPKRRRIGLPLLAGLLAILAGAVVWDISTTAWYQEWRFSRMPLESLKWERDAHDSRNPLLLYYIGRRLNEQDRFTEADGYLRQAVGHDPDSARYRDAWARALMGSGLTTAAFGELSEFVGTHPNLGEAHLLLGKFYVAQNSLQRAVDELTAATRLDPHLGEAWSYLAVAYQNRNELHPAREAAEKAAKLRPHNAGDQLLLAVLRANEGDANGARQAFEIALQRAPDMAVAHREYANFLLKTSPGEISHAVSLARRAIALDPNDANAQLILGRTLAVQGQNDEAVQHLRLAADKSPLDPIPALALSQQLRRTGHIAEADECLRLHTIRQEHAAAKDRLVSALELNPHDAKAHLALAHLLAQEGDIEGCVRHHAEALRKAPDSPSALADAADDLVSVGRAQDALPLAKRACAVTVSNPGANEAMGDVLLALQKPDEAISYYKKVLNWEPKRYPVFRAKIDAYYAAEEHRTSMGQAEALYQQSKSAMLGVRVPQEALRRAAEAVRLVPDNRTYLRQLMNLQFRANQRTDAIKTARHLLELAPEDKITHAVLAVLLIQEAHGAADLNEAESHLNGAAGDSASAPTWNYAKGLLALKRGDAATATDFLREAARLDPRPAVTFYQLSLAEAKAGHPKESANARAEYEKRHEESQAEAQALTDLGHHANDPQAYARAAAIFESFGRHTEADSIRAAAPSANKTTTQTKGK